MDKNLKNFWFFFSATIFSVMGMNLYIFTNGWYLIELGAPRPNIAVAWAIFFLPGTFLIFLSKKLMVIGRLKRSILSLEALKALTLVFSIFLFKAKPRVESVYFISGILGMFFVPFYPLTYTFLKELFKSNSVVRFSNLSEVSLQISGAIALFASGFIFKQFGFNGIVSVSAFCLSLSALLMCLIREPDASEVVSNPEGKASKIEKISSLKLCFGFFHLVPQVVILLLNIPTLIYVEKVMLGGPVEYGILDSVTAFSATLVSLFWAYFASRSSRISTFVAMGVVSALILFLLGTFYSHQYFFSYLAFAALGIFLISFKMMSRSQLMLTHSAQEVAKYSLYYQLLTNIGLVVGAFAMASLLETDNGQKSFRVLAVITVVYVLLIVPVLRKLRMSEQNSA